ncbi:MAG: hypothetical protein FJ123_00295 [Deltaproteobacteria bacterium]|nr:hypothetical protein [Deltaproteobacteria bacterium]
MVKKSIIFLFLTGIAILAFYFIIGLTTEKKSEMEAEVIEEPFTSEKEIVPKRPVKICKYEGVEAECDILLIFLYNKDTKSNIPKKEDYLYLDKVVNTVKEEGGRIIGQSPMLRSLTVEIKPKEKLLELKKILEQSGYVIQVEFKRSAKPL